MIHYKPAGLMVRVLDNDLITRTCTALKPNQISNEKYTIVRNGRKYFYSLVLVKMISKNGRKFVREITTTNLPEKQPITYIF